MTTTVVVDFILGLIWVFLTVAAIMAKAMATLIGAGLDQFGYEGAKATWAEEFEELLGDWAKGAYDGADGILEALRKALPQAAAFAAGGYRGSPAGSSTAQDKAAVTATARDLNQVVMDAVPWMDHLGKRCAPALASAHQDSLALRVPDNWRTRLRDAIHHESAMQQSWQELYTRDERSYGVIQWVEWVDRWAKVVIRIVQGFYFVAAACQNAMARALVRAASEAPSDAAARLLRWSTLREEQAQSATARAGKVETVADVASAVFVRGWIWGLEMGHMYAIVLLSHRRVVELYRQ